MVQQHGVFDSTETAIGLGQEPACQAKTATTRAWIHTKDTVPRCLVFAHRHEALRHWIVASSLQQSILEPVQSQF